MASQAPLLIIFFFLLSADNILGSFQPSPAVRKLLDDIAQTNETGGQSKSGVRGSESPHAGSATDDESPPSASVQVPPPAPVSKIVNQHVENNGTAIQRVSNNGGSGSQTVTNTGKGIQNVTNTGSGAQNVTNTGDGVQRVTNSGRAAQTVANSGKGIQEVTNSGNGSQNVSNTGKGVQKVINSGNATQMVTNSGNAVQNVSSSPDRDQCSITSDNNGTNGSNTASSVNVHGQRSVSCDNVHRQQTIRNKGGGVEISTTNTARAGGQQYSPPQNDLTPPGPFKGTTD